MTILVDTSVWADHFRYPEERLVALLGDGGVIVHPFVIGELALGNLRQRVSTIEALAALPMATRATDEEVMAFVEAHSLPGCGIGLVDAHLLASARLTAGALLWTKDKRLASAAEAMGLSYSE